MRIAHELARQLERDSNRFATQTVFGHVTDKTLGELLQAYHAAKQPEWTEHHRKAMGRFREFWTDHFGPDCALYMVTDGAVEEAGRSLDVSAETRRKYLVYITGAYRFARRKLKWIDEAHELTAVELPYGGTTPDDYSLDEVRRLLPALEARSDAAGWFGHALFQSGRRPITLRRLLKADVEVKADCSVLTVAAANDKAGKRGAVVLVGRAHELTAVLMARSGKYVLGEAVPDETTMLRWWLRPAETAAKVPHVQGRGWYGLKRRYAGEAHVDAGADTQSGVSRTTLVKHYRPDDLAPKRAVAERLAQLAIVEESVSTSGSGVS